MFLQKSQVTPLYYKYICLKIYDIKSVVFMLEQELNTSTLNIIIL